MKAEDLLSFLEEQMRMSHVYQPLLIRSLLDAGGQATTRQVATDFAKEDEAQVRYYEERIKQMPLRVLRKHGVVDYQDGVMRLQVDNLTFEERTKVRATCERKIAEFLSQRGVGAWSQSALNIEPLGESLRFQILKRDRICQLCGNPRRKNAWRWITLFRGQKAELMTLPIFKCCAPAVTAGKAIGMTLISDRK